MNKVLFIEMGMGVDLHGQDATTAAVRAVRNAIGHNSLPGMRGLLPDGDMANMKVELTLGAPVPANEIDVEQVKRTFPYGQVTVRIVPGGLLAKSGVVLPDKGDKNDDVIIINAVVEVGM
ncbi:MAG: Lin0512 family protein [Firmicutes bacterium]|nr:Lin0512 family protein [Bacillota bacterium]